MIFSSNKNDLKISDLDLKSSNLLMHSPAAAADGNVVGDGAGAWEAADVEHALSEYPASDRYGAPRREHGRALNWRILFFMMHSSRHSHMFKNQS